LSSTGEAATHRLALQVEDLHVSYGPKRAVDGVSLEINEGEIFGLLGPNGAGKTSTLSAIEGLVRPDSGSIRIGEVDARENPTAAKARMGVQLQSTSFQSDLTIREIVRLYAGLYGVPLTRAAGLDPQARRQLWDRIERLRDTGRSILLTTHSMEEAQAVCQRVAIIDRGKLLTVDTPAGLIEKHKDDPRVRKVAHGQVTLDDVFIGLTGSELRD